MPNIIIVGQRKQGKSTLATAVAATNSNTIVVWDPNDNFRSEAFEVVRPNERWSGTTRTLEQFLEAAAADPDNFHLARLGPVEQQDIEQHFRDTSEVLWSWREYAFIVDESMLLQKSAKLDDSLDRFLRRSPGDVYVIQTCHRLMDLHATSRYLVDDVIMFRLELPRERDLIAKQFDPNLAVLVPTLEDREYARWYRSPAGRTYFYRQPDSRLWFVDLRNPNTRADGSANRRRAGRTERNEAQSREAQQTNETVRDAATGPDDDDTAGDIDGDDAAAFAFD